MSSVFERLYSKHTFCFRMHCQQRDTVQRSPITECHPDRHHLFHSATLYKPTVAFTRSTIAYQEERKRVLAVQDASKAAATTTTTTSSSFSTPKKKFLSRVVPRTPATAPSSTPRRPVQRRARARAPPPPPKRTLTPARHVRPTPPIATPTPSPHRQAVVPQPQEAPVQEDEHNQHDPAVDDLEDLLASDHDHQEEVAALIGHDESEQEVVFHTQEDDKDEPLEPPEPQDKVISHDGDDDKAAADDDKAAADDLDDDLDDLLATERSEDDI